MTPRSARLVRVTLTGEDLAGLDIGLPAASVRLLLPPVGQAEVVLPSWNGNEFLFADGSRPPIRTLTPLRFDPDTNELDVEIVLHGSGPLSTWAAQVRPGDRAAVSGTGRGYTVDEEARHVLVAGDESALPAISVLLDALPADAAIQVFVELGHPSGRIDLPVRPGIEITWLDADPEGRSGDALAAAVMAATLPTDVRVWAAGEAAAVQRIRRHLFEEQGLTRGQAVVRGYWKHDRSPDGPADEDDA